MSQPNEHTIQDRSAEWLASCGFIFPSDPTEMNRFRQLHGPIDPTITGEEVDPHKIIRRTKDEMEKRTSEAARIKSWYNQSDYQMVAGKRNPFKKGK